MDQEQPYGLLRISPDELITSVVRQRAGHVLPAEDWLSLAVDHLVDSRCALLNDRTGFLAFIIPNRATDSSNFIAVEPFGTIFHGGFDTSALNPATVLDSIVRLCGTDADDVARIFRDMHLDPAGTSLDWSRATAIEAAKANFDPDQIPDHWASLETVHPAIASELTDLCDAISADAIRLWDKFTSMLDADLLFLLKQSGWGLDRYNYLSAGGDLSLSTHRRVAIQRYPALLDTFLGAEASFAADVAIPGLKPANWGHVRVFSTSLAGGGIPTRFCQFNAHHQSAVRRTLYLDVPQASLDAARQRASMKGLSSQEYLFTRKEAAAAKPIPSPWRGEDPIRSLIKAMTGGTPNLDRLDGKTPFELGYPRANPPTSDRGSSLLADITGLRDAGRRLPDGRDEWRGYQAVVTFTEDAGLNAIERSTLLSSYKGRWTEALHDPTLKAGQEFREMRETYAKGHNLQAAASDVGLSSVPSAEAALLVSGPGAMSPANLRAALERWRTQHQDVTTAKDRENSVAIPAPTVTKRERGTLETMV